MAIAHSKVTAQGQISVPAKVRRKLGIGPGSVLEWHEEGEKVVVRRGGRYTSEDVEIKAGVRRYTLEESEVVSSALEAFRKRPALGFSDCLMLEVARKAGHLPLGTFDRNLGKLEGAERL